MSLIPVIICGGAGLRLWPLSREAFPKPFIELPGGGTLIGQTYARASRLGDVDHIVTVTNRELMFLTADAYADAGVPPVENTFLLEPVGRDTAAAVALAALHATETHGPDTQLLVLPADHFIGDEAAFAGAVSRARELASAGRIVTFGITPKRPETGFGYIEVKGDDVQRFVEKPDVATAEEYIKSGRFLWNSGMFCFAAGTMVDAMQEHCPQILAGAREALAAARRSDSQGRSSYEVDAGAFSKVQATSIDYAVMEKVSNAACVPVDCDWSDIGSWTAMAGLLDADGNGNRAVGEVVFQDTDDCFVHSHGRLVGLVGVSDLIVVDTPDALLVTRRGKDQQVKKLAAHLNAQNHEAAKLHRTAHRPWGTYTVLQENDRYKIKRIEVKPGARLSLQAHHHRSEHWVVVAGTAKVVNGEQELLLATNQSTYIPCGFRHRLENPGILPLVMIEVQSGDYLGEDDIVRFDDVYGRA